MKISISTFLLLLAILTHGQSNEVRAKAAFLKAQELYGNADYSAAIEKLDQVKELLGSTNPRVEYLLTQCHFETKNIEKIDASIAAYFKMAAENDPNYMDMLRMIEEVGAVRASYNKVRAEKEKMEADWKKANELNSMAAFNQFIGKYPGSPYSNQAQAKLSSFPAPELYDERDGNSYSTVWVNGRLWMAEDLKYAPLAKFNKKTETYSYGRNNALNACPAGWKPPTYDMMVEMITSKIPTAEDVPGDGAWGKQRLLTIIDKSHISLFISSGWMISGLDKYQLNFDKGRLSYSQIWSQEGAFRINQPGSDIAIVIEHYQYPNYDASPFPEGACRCVKE